MEKLFSLRTQELYGQKVPLPGNWSSAEVIVPDNAETLRRRGRLFVVATLRGPENFDAAPVGHLLLDALQEEYYSLLEGSPLPALEKAVAAAHRRLLDIAHSLTTGKEGIDFNIVTAVLWGNILYLTKLGEGAVYILRRGVLREVGPVSDAQIAAASGLVEPEDVIIFGSHGFRQLFPIDVLQKNLEGLEKLMQENPRRQDLTALIIRLAFEEVPSEAEVLRFTPFTEKLAKGGGFSFLASLKGKLSSLHHPRRQVRLENTATNPAIYLDPLSPRERKQRRSRRLLGLTALVVLGFAVSTVFTIRTQRRARFEQEVKRLTVENEQKMTSATDLALISPEKTRGLLTEIIDSSKKIELLGDAVTAKIWLAKAEELLSKVNKTAAIESPKLIYDFMIQGKGSTPMALTGDKSNLYVADPGTDSLYRLDLTLDPVKVERLGGTELNKPRLVAFYDNALFGLDSKGAFKVDLKDNTVTPNLLKSLDPGAPSTFSVYLGNLYFLDPAAGELAKYAPVLKGYAGKINWFKETVDLSEVIGLATDGDMYLLFKNGTLKKYTLGRAADYFIQGLDKPLSDPRGLYTSPDLNDLFVVDDGGKRIVILSKDGVFVRQLVFSAGGPAAPSRLWVDDATPVLYLLDGTKVFRVDLPADL